MHYFFFSNKYKQFLHQCFSQIQFLIQFTFGNNKKIKIVLMPRDMRGFHFIIYNIDLRLRAPEQEATAIKWRLSIHLVARSLHQI